MSRLMVLLLMLSCALFSAGCMSVPLIVGAAAGGAGVYAASKDTIQGETDVTYDVLWNAAITVARVRGTIQKQDFDQGRIEGIDGKAVKFWIAMERLTLSTTRLKVSSRKYKMPNLELAQTMYTKIIDQAKESVRK